MTKRFLHSVISRLIDFKNTVFILGFATGQDSANFQDKGTEVPTLSQDKGTTGQAQNLAKGQDGPGNPVKIQDGI